MEYIFLLSGDLAKEEVLTLFNVKMQNSGLKINSRIMCTEA